VLLFTADGAALPRKAAKMEKPVEEQVRIRAHELWEGAGKPDRRECEFWHEAEREIIRETEDLSVIAQRPEPASLFPWVPL
jgi:Protein of unknown function (DUF2934)